jgi:signal transduction histidine kinase
MTRVNQATHPTPAPLPAPAARPIVRGTGAAIAVGVAGVLGILLLFAADVRFGTDFTGAIGYSVILLACLFASHRGLLWTLTFIALALTWIATGLEASTPRSVAHRALATASLLATAIICHALITSRRREHETREALIRRQDSLEASNTELATREEEITTQNEELQSQTEELERQSEELRVANEELSRRERTLESLLRLSRELTAEMSRDDVMQRVCEALAELINGPNVGTGIKLREGDQLRLVCHHGFGRDGPAELTLPFARSFARLVLERNSTGFLEDVSLRPEIQIPQPASGPKFQSILAAPLRVNRHAVGSLEVYSHDKRVWTEEQIAMIESLAAQTSISLQTAELFERIEQERRRLGAVLQTIPFTVMIANADLTDVRMNAAGAALRGIPPDTNVAIVGPQLAQPYQLFDRGVLLDPDDHPLTRAVRRGEVTRSREIEVVVDGRRRYTMLYSAAPVRDKDGKILGGVCAAADITDQKQLQHELDARRREAEEASVRKTRFLAAVSHDIRTPANAISLLAELLQRSATTPAMAGEIPEIVNDLRSSSLTLVNLVSAVLDLTRFDAGRIDLDESEFPLESLVHEECRQMQPVAREKGLLFTCDLPPASLVIRADRIKLSRIVQNLLTNAIKFTTEGGVNVTAGLSPQREAWVRVADTGIGIPQQYQEKIFDEFFQLKGGDGERRDGSGLGLAICRRLVQAMGGSISVQSEPGKGSTFTVTLPASSVVAAPASA